MILCLAIVRDEGGSGAKLIVACSFGNTVLRTQVSRVDRRVDLVSVTTGVPWTSRVSQCSTEGVWVGRVE